METIKVRDLNFTYPTADSPALTGVSFDVMPSEFVVVCGKSGCEIGRASCRERV